MNIVAIIAARGGSKGIPQKNLIDFCGKPLIQWSIELAVGTDAINSVWVTTDDDNIKELSRKIQANTVDRPPDISGDVVMPEPAWEHALDQIERETKQKVDLVLAMQATSPLRKSDDLKKGIDTFLANDYDSLFSASKIDDMFFWEKNATGELESVNYDWEKRKRRQDFSPQYVENGSFYLFKPEIIRQNKNRLGGHIGMYLMEFWQMFEIDTPRDLNFCKLLMNNYVLGD